LDPPRRPIRITSPAAAPSTASPLAIGSDHLFIRWLAPVAVGHKLRPDGLRQLVQLHTTIGTPQEDIARILDIDPKTLRKHYRDELDLAKAKANATIGGALFNKAKAGDTAAMIFWMKTQAGWREKTDLNHISEDGTMTPQPAIDASKLKSDTLEDILNAATDEG